MSVTPDKKKQLLDLVKQAHDEEYENIKRSRRNAQRTAAEDLEPYQNNALIELTDEIGRIITSP